MYTNLRPLPPFSNAKCQLEFAIRHCLFRAFEPKNLTLFFTAPTENLSNLRNLRSICLAVPIFLLIFAACILMHEHFICSIATRIRTSESERAINIHNEACALSACFPIVDIGRPKPELRMVNACAFLISKG